MACILILQCRNTCNCFQRNRCKRQIIYLELCCCCFGWGWGRQHWGWTCVADKGSSRHLYVAGFTFRGNNGDQQRGPQSIWFFCAQQEKKRSEEESHIWASTKSLRTTNIQFILGVCRQCWARLKGELWRRMFKFNVDDYKGRSCKEVHSFRRLWQFQELCCLLK